MWFQEEVNAGNYAINARLMNNISASPTFRSYDWKPIAGSSIDNTEIGYEGIFDGQGYNISLFPKAMTPEYDGAVLGLFGTLKSGAVVKNLSISNRREYGFSNNGTNYSYTGEYTVYVGMIAGRVLEGATVSGCRVANGTVSISNGVLGAIVGVNYGTVENCVSYGMTLSGPEGRVGGIAGDYSGGTLINCYTTYSSLGSTASGYVGTSTDSEAGVTDARMISGEITYKMNSYVGDPEFWYQRIGSGGPTGRSEYDVVGKIVYAYDFGSAILYSNNEYKYTLTENLLIASGKTFTVPIGMTVEIPEGLTLTNSGTLIKNGTLTGKGTLNGLGSFLITEIDPEILPTVDDIVYDGNNHTNDVIITVSAAFSAFGKTFTPEGYTFYKSFTEVKDAGYYEIGYVSEAESYLVSFNVTPLSVSDADVSLEYSEALYNGTELQPLAMLSGFTLSLGKDYSVSYENNVASGVATATVTFRGNFSGEFTREFTISPVVIGESAEASAPDSAEFTGLELDPVSVTVNGVALTRGKDYTATYTNNIYPGTATVTVVGIGSVSGEASFTFAVTRPAFTVTVFDQVLPYNEDSNVKPFDQTMYEGEGLVDGHTVVLGEPLVSGGTDELITVLQILDANGNDVLEYYDLTVVATGKYHMYYETYHFDNYGYHWRNCVYNCDEISDYGIHVGEPATCHENSKCSLCNAWYQFATGIHTWVDGTCSVCGTANPYEVWIDTDGNGQYNGDEVGYGSFNYILAYGESGTYKLSCDVSSYVGGIGLNTNQSIVIDLNGRTFEITGIMSLQNDNTTITFIDSSPTKSGKIVGTGSTAIWITNSTAKLILDGVSVEGKVSVWEGELELKNGAVINLFESDGGTLRLYEGYDIGTLTINPADSGEYKTIVYIGSLLMVHNVETGALECSENHTWVDADCTVGKHCSFCNKLDGDPLGHDTNGAPTCEVDEYCYRCESVVNPAIGHKVEIIDAVAPTCDTAGSTQGSRCANCGEIYLAPEEIEALGHTPSDAVLDPYQGGEMLPSCDFSAENDYVVYCAVCGDELSRETVVTDALGHTETREITSKVDPNCVAAGWVKYKYTCMVCTGVRYETVDVEANGHTPGEMEIISIYEATCRYEGSINSQVKCVDCDVTLESKSEVIPTLDHVPNIDTPTCVNYKYCINCYVTIEDFSDHDYVETVLEADCENAGGIKNVCKVCNHTVFDETSPAKGHDPDREAPTCTEDKKCNECGEILQSATGHSLSGGNCTVDDYCTVCGEVFTAASGHSFNVEEATCLWNKYCYNCGYIAQEALGHTPDKDAASCTDDVLCTVCNDVIEYAPGHNTNDGATCTENFYCYTCGEILAHATGHNVSEATCYTGSYCAICKEVFSEALGHDYKMEVIYEGDCFRGGEYSYTCQRCYDSYMEYTDTVPHTPVQWEGVESTCTSQGYEGRIVCDFCGFVIAYEKTLPFAPHTDGDGDGACDDCGADTAGPHDCVDEDPADHSCDICRAIMSAHSVPEGTHNCEICGEAQSECADNQFGYCSICELKIVGQSVRLGDNFDMKYFVQIYDESLIEGKSLTMELDFLGKTTEVDGTYNGVYYVFTLEGILAENMGDRINAYLLIEGERVASKLNYSIKDNLTNLLAAARDEKLIALINDTLAYGAAAQKAKDYREDAPVTDGVLGYAPSERTPEKQTALENTDGSVTIESYELLLGKVPYFRFTLNAESLDGVEIRIDGFTVSDQFIYNKGDGKYVVISNSLNFANASEDITLDIFKGEEKVSSITTSTGAYANDENVSAEACALALAVYNLGVSVREYLGI